MVAKVFRMLMLEGCDLQGCCCAFLRGVQSLFNACSCCVVARVLLTGPSEKSL